MNAIRYSIYLILFPLACLAVVALLVLDGSLSVRGWFRLMYEVIREDES